MQPKPKRGAEAGEFGRDRRWPHPTSAPSKRLPGSARPPNPPPGRGLREATIDEELVAGGQDLPRALALPPVESDAIRCIRRAGPRRTAQLVVNVGLPPSPYLMSMFTGMGNVSALGL